MLSYPSYRYHLQQSILLPQDGLSLSIGHHFLCSDCVGVLHSIHFCGRGCCWPTKRKVGRTNCTEKKGNVIGKEGTNRVLTDCSSCRFTGYWIYTCWRERRFCHVVFINPVQTILLQEFHEKMKPLPFRK